MKSDFLLGVGVAAVIIFLLSYAAGAWIEADDRAAHQAQLDTLYSAAVGDSASVLSALQDANRAMFQLCTTIAEAQGVDPRFCIVNPPTDDMELE
jgi:hypothetical protein